MARIRTIKPETPQSESMRKLSREARLLFILLWTIADDEGRARAASRLLASLLYPYDDDAPGLIDDWLDQLEGAGSILRYEADGSRYLVIVNWLKHQKIDKPSKSRLPPPPEGSLKTLEVSRSLATDLGPRTSTLDLGGGVDLARAREASKISEGWTPAAPTTGRLKALGLSEDDIAKSVRRFVLNHRAKGTERADWDAQFELWASDDAKKLGRAPTAAAPLAAHTNHQIEDTRWAPIRSVLMPMVGPEPYRSWFAALTIAVLDEKAIVFRAPTRFLKTKLEDDCWGDRLRDAVNTAYPGRAIKIEVEQPVQEKKSA